MERFDPPGDCPVCGEYVEEGASSCKSCGSCHQSGWSEETGYDGLDLPEDPDAETSVGFGDEKSMGKKLALAAVLLIAVIVLYILSKP